MDACYGRANFITDPQAPGASALFILPRWLCRFTRSRKPRPRFRCSKQELHHSFQTIRDVDCSGCGCRGHGARYLFFGRARINCGALIIDFFHYPMDGSSVSSLSRHISAAQENSAGNRPISFKQPRSRRTYFASPIFCRRICHKFT